VQVPTVRFTPNHQRTQRGRPSTALLEEALIFRSLKSPSAHTIQYTKDSSPPASLLGLPPTGCRVPTAADVKVGLFSIVRRFHLCAWEALPRSGEDDQELVHLEDLR
jgi:hypothetical protein